MYDVIQAAYQRLVAEVTQFNETWPSLVVAGKVWRVPVLQEQRTPDVIEVEALTGQQAIDATVAALRTFQRDIDQAPGTVMRLPGYFQLSASVLPLAMAVNTAKLALMDAIEAERVAQNLAPEMRPKLMRKALGSSLFSTKQLQRTLHVFDGAPRRISFTWAGHTTSTERIRVAKVREQLAHAAKLRAAAEDIPVQQTPEYLDLAAIIRLDDADVLIKHKQIAPHPRCTLWFGPTGMKWDAQPKANLPVFVLAGDGQMKLSDLKHFDKAVRNERRRDVKARQEVWPQRHMYLPGPKGQSTQAEAPVKEGALHSTYRLGGVVYEPT